MATIKTNTRELEISIIETITDPEGHVIDRYDMSDGMLTETNATTDEANAHILTEEDADWWLWFATNYQRVLDMLATADEKAKDAYYDRYIEGDYESYVYAAIDTLGIEVERF